PGADSGRDMTRSTEQRVEADEREGNEDDGAGREGDGARREGPPLQAEPQNGKRRSEYQQPPSVRTRLAPADAHERESAGGNEPAYAAGGHSGDDRREQQRLDLVADAVIAAAAVGTRAEHGERVELRIDCQKNREGDKKQGHERRQDLPSRSCQQRERRRARRHREQQYPEPSDAGPR